MTKKPKKKLTLAERLSNEVESCKHAINLFHREQAQNNKLLSRAARAEDRATRLEKMRLALYQSLVHERADLEARIIAIDTRVRALDMPLPWETVSATVNQADKPEDDEDVPF